jgi:hypothetical protein
MAVRTIANVLFDQTDKKTTAKQQEQNEMAGYAEDRLKVTIHVTYAEGDKRRVGTRQWARRRAECLVQSARMTNQK